MARSDFTTVNFFDERFGGDITEATRTFNIEGNPISTGYLLIQHFDVEVRGHQILINNRNLPGFDIPPHKDINEQWFTWMDIIPQGFMHQGKNSITIKRTNCDKRPERCEGFRVGTVAIHWREAG